MILLSNGGTNARRSRATSDTMVIGTVDGIVLLERAAQGWTIKHRALGGCSVSAVTASEDGTLFAATHGFGAARSEDGGLTWTWILDGLDHMDLWSARAGKLKGRDVVCVGALPAHLYISENAARAGANCRRCAARRASANGASRRRRASATSRISCSTATACWSASRSALCWCRRISAQASPSLLSIPIRSNAISTACWC